MQEWMLVLDYMIFIMEEIKMWKIQKKEESDIWISDMCILTIQYSEDVCRVFIDYKGYNPIMPMGIWGFEEEIEERSIWFDVDGEKGNFKSLYYKVKVNDLKLFCDMIYFFLSEHNLDKTLNDSFKY